MKLALSLFIMAIALVGLIYILKPASKKKQQVRLKQKKTPNKLPPAQPKKQTATLPQSATGDQPASEPTMEEIRFAVRKYVTKFPGVTADVMQDWIKKRP